MNISKLHVNIYITGETYGFLARNNVRGSDAWVAKYNNWLQQLITSGYDKYNRVAGDTAGNVYIAN